MQYELHRSQVIHGLNDGIVVFLCTVVTGGTTLAYMFTVLVDITYGWLRRRCLCSDCSDVGSQVQRLPGALFSESVAHQVGLKVCV